MMSEGNTNCRRGSVILYQHNIIAQFNSDSGTLLSMQIYSIQAAPFTSFSDLSAHLGEYIDTPHPASGGLADFTTNRNNVINGILLVSSSPAVLRATSRSWSNNYQTLSTLYSITDEVKRVTR